jgi:hypothetical protein
VESAVPSLQSAKGPYRSFVPPPSTSTWVQPPSPVAVLLYPVAPPRSYAFFTPPMSEHPTLTNQPSLDTLNRPSTPRKWVTEVWIHITRHVGVGLICSVAYFDPCVSFPAVFPLCRRGSSAFFFIEETGVSIYRQAQTLDTNSSSSSYWQAYLL